MAAEGRGLIRRAAGDVAGKTVAAQIRQAVRHLGYAPDDWRPRELWYGRCASPVVLDDLRARFAAWRAREQTGSAPASLALRLAAVRDGLVELQRRFGELEAEVQSRDIGHHTNGGSPT